MKEESMEKIRKKKESVEKLFTAEHRKYTFWSPKDNINGNNKGYMLYAYGGYVLGLYLDDKDNIKVDMNVSKEYCEYSISADTEPLSEVEYVEYKEKYEERLAPIKQFILSGNQETEAEKAFDFAFAVCKNRAEGAAHNKSKCYWERMRETAIARNHSNAGEAFRIVEMESKIPAEGKKPDLIGIQITDKKPIFYFTEYKCTTGAMDGNQRPLVHLEDMAKYYNTLSLSNFESYAERLGQSVDLSNAERKILFLFSNVGKSDKAGMTYKKAINGIIALKESKYYETANKDIRIAVIQDENEKIDPKKFCSVEEAIDWLKKREITDK